MPRAKSKTKAPRRRRGSLPTEPSLHRPSQQAIVRLKDGDLGYKIIYLGRWPDPTKPPPREVMRKFDQTVAEYLANGRRLTVPEQAEGGVTFGELAARFFAERKSEISTKTWR